jgi:hypothetical protein
MRTEKSNKVVKILKGGVQNSFYRGGIGSRENFGNNA